MRITGFKVRQLLRLGLASAQNNYYNDTAMDPIPDQCWFTICDACPTLVK